jgi:tetratricopeptide (TPR) repeat protein
MKNFKTIILVVLIALSGIVSKAQDTTSQNVISAFETSYIFETAQQYNKAAIQIKNVYEAKSYEMNLRLGWLTYYSGSYIESSGYYRKAVSLKPRSIEARLGYVMPLAALGSWDSVRVQYEQILKIDPMNSTVNYRMGLIYFYKGNYKTAETYLKTAAELYPFDYDITLMSAKNQEKLGNKDSAKSLYTKVLIIQPNDSTALSGLKTLK